PYMSPDQLQGHTLDARSDLHALGVVVFEMVTGRRPFVESQPAALMYAIVNTAPPRPSAVCPGVSAPLEALILRLLREAPERRPASARETAEALGRIAAGEAVPAGPPRIESLAVLPLRDLSGDPAQEFFADGITEALITALAQLSALRVISSTSVM